LEVLLDLPIKTGGGAKRAPPPFTFHRSFPFTFPPGNLTSKLIDLESCFFFSLCVIPDLNRIKPSNILSEHPRGPQRPQKGQNHNESCTFAANSLLFGVSTPQADERNIRNIRRGTGGDRRPGGPPGGRGTCHTASSERMHAAPPFFRHHDHLIAYPVGGNVKW